MCYDSLMPQLQCFWKEGQLPPVLALRSYAWLVRLFLLSARASEDPATSYCASWSRVRTHSAGKLRLQTVASRACHTQAEFGFAT